MNLSSEEKARRKGSLRPFNVLNGIKFRLHRFHPPNDWNAKWYGVPEVRSESRVFMIHPKGLEALEKSMQVLNSLGWGKHIVCILTGGANVERNQRGTDKPSPHSIRKGTVDQDIFATAIDIGGVVWQHKAEGPSVSYVADRSAKPRVVGIDEFDPAYNLIPPIDLVPDDTSSEVLSIVPAFDTPYVVMACVFSQFFGTVLHDKCGGYTGKIHRDHFHLDCTRPVKYRYSNSQNTLIQMALNLFADNELKIDGDIGPQTLETWEVWSELYLGEPLSSDINESWMKLMVKTALEKGQG